MCFNKLVRHEGKCFESVYDNNSKKGRTALHLAVRYNRPWCIKVLIQAGADIEAIDEDTATPISIAAWQKDCASIAILDTLGARTGHLDKKKRNEVDKCYNCKFFKALTIRERQPVTTCLLNIYKEIFI